MKKLILFSMVLLATFSLLACKNKSAPATADNPVPEKQVVQNTAAPVEAPTAAPQKAENVQGKNNVVAIQRAVLDFRAAKGRFPESLEELKASAQIDIDVSKYNYDAVYGRVTLKK